MIEFVRKQFLSVILLLLSSIVLLAQENGRYTGPMQVGTYDGKADYQYIISNSDTIYDGTFQVQRSSLEALLEKKDISFLFKGNFNQGIANGDWQFQFGEFQTESKSQVVDYEYRVLISGIQEEGIGAILNGRADGKWTYTKNLIKDSEIEKALFKSSLTFENGVPQQNFQIENDSLSMIGRFLRNGLAHDEWSCFSEDAIEDTESWFFDEGILRKIRTVKDGLTSEIPIFVPSESYKTIRLNGSFLSLIQAIALTNGKSIDISKGIAGLLHQNEQSYQRIDTVLSQLESSDFLPELRVKVPFKPLDSLETVTLNKISDDFVESDAISQELLRNSHLNIVRRSDTDVQYKYQVVKKIAETFLRPLEKLHGYKQQGIIDYMEVGRVLGQLWPNGKPSTDISVSDGQRIFRLSNALEYGFESDDLESVRQLAEYAKLSLTQIKASLSSQLTNEQRLQKLNGLEEELIAANDSLVRKIDSTVSSLPRKHAKALESIKQLSESSLSDYAAIENAEEKLSYGTALKICLGEFSNLATSLIKIPEVNEQIQALYQDAIWNPFMATVMDEEVKKRITTAYSKILIPYFIEGVSDTLSCENAAVWNNQIVHTNNRMRELRDEDTRKLERKLRREKNPEEILKLLHQGTSED